MELEHLVKLSDNCSFQVPVEVLKYVLALYWYSEYSVVLGNLMHKRIKDLLPGSVFLFSHWRWVWWTYYHGVWCPYLLGLILFSFFLLFSLIDNGKNPDEFTKNVINSCIAKNQVTKGKTDSFKVIIVCSLTLGTVLQNRILVFLHFSGFTKASSRGTRGDISWWSWIL